ncbi:kinase-like domain-containing protein [Thelephora terrestris]|uniref:Kinase-like domain-containing protein n=1 Tax=Thelephora terrestris TaxID=56493 RepID=A0A9P6HN52_9AGAM|nr:kinase-like domain-containing protein [Thelephora terrestris]
MATRISEIKESLLGDKITILEGKAADAPPGTQQVIQTVISDILTLVRDKLTADEYSMQLFDYCFDVCEVVKNLDGSVPIGPLEDLGRVFGEIALTIRRGSTVPHLQYDKDKIEGHKPEIQEILSALNAPTSSPPKESTAVPDESVAPKPPTGSCDPTTNSASQSAMRRLIGRTFPPDQLASLVETICTCKNSSGTIRSLTGDDAQTFIDAVDEALDRPDLPPSVRKQCLRPLYKTCGRHALLPTSLKIPICYDQTSDASYSGGYADVWKGEHCGRDVAVKVIRRYLNSDLQKVVGRFCKEVVTWRTLHHPNVLALIGVTMTETKFAMISDWMNGSMREFLEKNRGANRLKLLEDVATGLVYLHSQGMIHGDLKGANVLIDNTGHARLADFGLLKIIYDPSNPSSPSSCTQGGSARWMSPELLDPGRFRLKKSRPTKSSDCYALGMVIYETITEKVLFQGESIFIVTQRILAGEDPPRGERFTNCLWLHQENHLSLFQRFNRPFLRTR